MNRFFKDVRTIERISEALWAATSPSMAMSCSPTAFAESQVDESCNWLPISLDGWTGKKIVANQVFAKHVGDYLQSANDPAFASIWVTVQL